MTITPENFNSCLKIVPIFSGLADEDLAKINKIVREQEFKKGETLFKPGDTADTLVIMHQGQVKLTNFGSEGQEKIISLLQAGDFDGTATLFKPTKHRLYGIAVTKGEACVLDRGAFQQVMLDSPELALKILNEFGTKLVEQQQNYARNTTTTALGRVASYLLEYRAQVDELEFKLPFKKYELANLLDLTPETLSRQLKKLEQDGLIENLPQNTIKILDEDELTFLI